MNPISQLGNWWRGTEWTWPGACRAGGSASTSCALQAGIYSFSSAFCHPLQPWETALSLGKELTFAGKSLTFSVQQSICFSSECSPIEEILVLKYLASGFFSLSFLIPFFLLFFYLFLFLSFKRGKPSLSRCRETAVAAKQLCRHACCLSHIRLS